MKYILLFSLLIPLSAFSQKKAIVRQENRQVLTNDTTQLGDFYFIQNNDSFWLEKPLGTFKARLDSVRSGGGSGSTITASDGVYMDGDTIKWKKDQIATGDSTISINYVGNNSFAYAGAYMTGGKYDSYSYLGAESLINRQNANLEAYPDYMKFVFNSVIENPFILLQIDTTGIHYLAGHSPDTTHTTPDHLLTEAQVKREINAMQPTNNIFSWDAANKWYAPYSSKQASMSFYTGTTTPDGTTRLNLNGALFSTSLEVYKGISSSLTSSGWAARTYSTSSTDDSSGGLYASSVVGIAASIRNDGSPSVAKTQPTLYITRNLGGTQNIGGNIIDILDNPTSTGTIAGKVLSATIGTNERISLNPRVVSTGSAVAYLLDTHNALTSGDKLLSVKNQGTEKVSIDKDGVLTYKGTFAGIYVSDGSTAQSISTGATYTKLTGFTTNGESSNCTADVANDKITITKTGRYFVSWSMSLTSGTNSVITYVTPFLGGTEQNSSHAARKIGTGSDLGAMAGSGFINVTTVPVDLDLRARTDNAGSVNITPVYMNMTVNYVGE